MCKRSNLLICLFLAGCGHPTGVMAPVTSSASAGSAQIAMLVATTRQPSGDPATLFTGERSPTPFMTAVTVSIPAGRQEGTVQWPKRLPPNPSTDFAVTDVQSLRTVSDGRVWLHRHNKSGHVLVFVHGFNNTYEDSVFRLAQIVHDSGMDATPMLFTWPSRARLRAYEYDKESTNYSRTAFEQSLRVLAKDPAVKEITILAHSMGTWLAMESLRQMGIRDGRVNAKIDNVILASPDIDIEVFAKQFVEMGPDKPKFTVFVSQDDRALAASSLITGGISRLGAINPAEEPNRSRLEAGGITAIDLTKVKSNDRLNHGKFAESPEIVQLIGQRLMTGQTLTDSNISLGEGIASVVGGTVLTVGTVTGAAIAAPVTLVTPRHNPTTIDVGHTLRTDPETSPLVE